MKTLKKTAISIAILAIFMMASAFTYQSLNKNTAIVEQMQGVCIFYKSKPAGNYDYIGSVKAPGITNSVKPGPMVETMIKKMKKDYSSADGIIFTDENMDKADAIKLKD
ncbi:MAG: hypothetical protein WC707_06890 [Candidatus Babeliaceae bacterium]|jgi:hypothetical protein